MGIAAFCLTTFAFRLAMADHDVNFGPSYSVFLTIGALIGGGFVLQQMLLPAELLRRLPAIRLAGTVATAPPRVHVVMGRRSLLP